MARRYEPSDARREAIRGQLPGKEGDPGRTAPDDRLFVNAVSYVAKTGIPRPDLPGRFGKPDTARKRFGKPDTARKRFDRRCRSGVRERPARASGAPDLAELRLDSTTVKARPAAATGRKRAGEKKNTPTRGGASAAAGAGRRPSSMPRPTRKAARCGCAVRLRLSPGRCGDAP